MNIREQSIWKPETWQGALGLLPVGMFPRQHAGDGRYVLMNGAKGNFCLNASHQEIDFKERASHAWSCNVGHYLSLRDGYIEVSRWDDSDRVEKYTVSSVIDNLVEFHAYLEKASPENSTGIAEHYGRAFRRLRSVWQTQGETALQAFLYLVACAGSDRLDLTDAELAIWDIPNLGKQAAETLRSSDRESIVEQIAGIGSYKSLKPNLGLVIRHASGAVFEDAHRIAQTSGQLWFDGFIGEAQITAGSESLGVHFTPSSVARTLAEEAVYCLDISRPEIVAFDPACGSAELLKELIRILERRGFSGVLRLYGCDISAAAVAMARFTLAYEKRADRAFRIEYQIDEGDVLAKDWPKDCAVVIMNPPFKRWNDLKPEQQQQMMDLLGVASTRANYATAFLHKAATALVQGGVLAAVCPKAIFETTASTATRTLLAENLAPRLVARLGTQNLFKGSLVDAGLYVGVKGGDLSVPSLSLWADQNQDSTAAALRSLRKRFVVGAISTIDTGFSIYPDSNIGRSGKPWTPRSRTAVENWAAAEKRGKLIKASGCFEIRQGARMGDDVFVVEKAYVCQLPAKEQAFFRPAVLNSSIQSGVLNDRYYVFYPHTLGLPSLDTEEDLLHHVETYARGYLIPRKEKLQKRKFKTPNPKWWEMIWPRSWQYEKSPKLVSKYFGGAGAFAWDSTGDFVVVVGHAWVPKDDPGIRVDLVAPFSVTVGVYLNLPETEGLIDYLSVRVAGGQLDLSSRYLKQLLIPSLKKLPESVVSEICSRASGDLTDRGAQELLRSALG